MLEKWEIPIPEGARIGPTISAGEYSAKVSGTPELTESRRGTKQLRFTVTITEGNFEGQNIDVYRPISSPRAWGRLIGTLDALEVDYSTDSTSGSGKLNIDPVSFIGKECRIVVEDREWQGRKRPRVTDIRPISKIETAVDENLNEDS